MPLSVYASPNRPLPPQSLPGMSCCVTTAVHNSHIDSQRSLHNGTFYKYVLCRIIFFNVSYLEQDELRWVNFFDSLITQHSESKATEKKRTKLKTQSSHAEITHIILHGPQPRPQQTRSSHESQLKVNGCTVNTLYHSKSRRPSLLDKGSNTISTSTCLSNSLLSQRSPFTFLGHWVVCVNKKQVCIRHGLARHKALFFKVHF